MVICFWYLVVIVVWLGWFIILSDFVFCFIARVGFLFYLVLVMVFVGWWIWRVLVDGFG